MKKYDFIFSNRFIPKVSRQVIFILCFLLYFFYVNLLPASAQDLFHSKTYLRSLQMLIYAPVSIVAVYIAIYVLLPRFIYPGKYLALMAFMPVLTAIYFFMALLTTHLFARISQPLPYHDLPVSFRWFLPVRYGIGFPVTSTILVIIVKLFKNFHLIQKEHEFLLRQKINTELQLIKTRFKPQFLYNTLQYISSLIRNHSVDSTLVLLKLSDLLSYVLYEHEKERVPLEHELEILKTFLTLKNSAQPGECIIRLSQQIKPGLYFISPLRLLAIVENCLESIYQNDGQSISVNLIIKTIDNELHVQLECMEEKTNSHSDTAFYNCLKQSLEKIYLLYEEVKRPDLFTENGTTYLILVFVLSEVSSLNKKNIQMAVSV